MYFLCVLLIFSAPQMFTALSKANPSSVDKN